MLTSLYGSSLSHGEISPVWSHVLWCMPLVDQKRECSAPSLQFDAAERSDN